jgi:hypothetical protein
MIKVQLREVTERSIMLCNYKYSETVISPYDSAKKPEEFSD